MSHPHPVHHSPQDTTNEGGGLLARESLGQLHGFADGTPGGLLLEPALSQPELAGVAVALLEIAIGVLVLLGFLTRIAAAAGLVLNLVLFLTASWHTVPYFLGSDSVFAFAWLPFALAGAAGQPALDNPAPAT